MSIFITGNSRSGTTMMSRILGNHPQVLTFQELHFFDEILSAGQANAEINIQEASKLFAKLCAIQRNGYFGSKNYKPFLEEANNYLTGKTPLTNGSVYNLFLTYETLKHGKKISCEQTPQNIFALENIFKSFPDAKVIVMIRDPREVLLSQKNKWKRRQLSGGQIPFWESMRSRINYHPIIISRIWNSVMKTADHYKNHVGVLFVKYEDLILNPESVIKNVCAHCGINYQHNMLKIPVVGSSNFNDTAQTLGIDASKTGLWKNGKLNAAEIHICQSVNANLMNLYGYEKLNANANLLTLAWYKLSLPFQLAIALLFNLKRLKNPVKILKQFTN